MELAYRTDAKRTSALAVVVVFLAVLFGVSQFAPRHDDGSQTDAAIARLQGDVDRLRAAAAPVPHRSNTGSPRLVAETARLVDDLDAPGLSVPVRARLLDHASGAVVGVCEECYEILQAARPTRPSHDASQSHRGLWARKMIGLAP